MDIGNNILFCPGKVLAYIPTEAIPSLWMISLTIKLRPSGGHLDALEL